MGAFASALGSMLKRPFLILFIGITALIYSVFDYYFPILYIFLRINPHPFDKGDIFKSIVSLLQGGLDYLFTTRHMVMAFAGIASLSLLLAFFLSGYFNVVHSTMNKKGNAADQFGGGVRKYFLKMWWMLFLVLLLGVAFAIFAVIAAVPAMIFTTAALSHKAGYLLAAVLIDFITVFVIFFCIMFFRAYLLFWFPSTYAAGRSAFGQGRKVVDRCFWHLVRRFLLLDVIFILFGIFALNIGNSLFSLTAKWIFYTAFFGFYLPYIFALFKVYSGIGEKQYNTAEE